MPYGITFYKCMFFFIVFSFVFSILVYSCHEQHFQRKENECNNVLFENADWSKRRSEISFLGNYALGKMRKGAQKKSEDESEKSSI